VLAHKADGRHHRHAAVLQLRRAELVEAHLVTHGGEAQRVEVAQRLHGTDLRSRREGRRGRRHILGCCSRGRQTELLDRILARRNLRREDAKHGDHGHAPIGDLLHAHLLVVHVEAEGVTEVARLRALLLAPGQLQDCGEEEDAYEAKDALASAQSAQARGRLLEARELDEVLAHKADGRHHRHAAVLQLRRAELVEAHLVTHGGEAQRVEVAQRLHGTDLRSRREGRRGRRHILGCRSCGCCRRTRHAAVPACAHDGQGTGRDCRHVRAASHRGQHCTGQSRLRSGGQLHPRSGRCPGACGRR